MSPDPYILQTVLESAPGAVLVCEAHEGDWRTIFVNRAMEQLTGYSAADFLGRNPRLLAGDDHDQEGLARLRSAVETGETCSTMVRNYRRDGTQFWNEIHLIPVRSATGAVTHFASFHRDAGDRMRLDARAEKTDPMMSTQTMMAYLRDDKLTGLLRRPYFEELVKRDWSLAQRESRRLSFMVFDLDHFSQYLNVFGRQGADQSFRRIARAVCSGFRRASDLCGRFDEDQIAALTTGIDLAQATKLAELVLARVRDLAIHHPRSSVSRFVTASAGVVSWVPPQTAQSTELFDAALAALKEAKQRGRNQIVVQECGEAMA
jgi:diguanylate cyclase (GGDEF)-like protein/PAS domain S-box-containing protein